MKQALCLMACTLAAVASLPSRVLAATDEDPTAASATDRDPPPSVAPDPTWEADRLFPEGSDVEPTWRVGGFLQNQTGVFVSGERNRDLLKIDSSGKPVYGSDKVPESHGGNLGTLSMCRFTFQLDADWRPTKRIWTHVTLRLARSLTLKSDEDAQVPAAGYTGASNASRRRNWVRDNYYNETDVREFFVNFRATSWLNVRLGRQLVAWGEAGNSRLLDVVNPVNSTWHFSGFESYEDQRMPLWMVRVLADIPILRGGLDVVWVPMLPLMERPEDTVTVPLTFVNAWGLPTPPKQIDDSVSPKKVYSKSLMIPHEFGVDSRIGFRWKGNAGKFLTYSLMYFYTHQLSPPIPRYLNRPVDMKTFDPAYPEYYTTDRATYDVLLEFPRQHLIGFSLEGQVPFPLGTMVKLEAALEPDRTYAMNSGANKPPAVLVKDNTIEQQDFLQRKLLTFQYALTLQQPFWIRAINREEPFILVAQFQHTIVPDIDDLDLTSAVVEVPGYDTTVVAKHQFRIIGALFTSFLKGTITPKIAAGWIPKTTALKYVEDAGFWNWTLRRQSASHGSGFATFSLGFKVFDSMRLTVAYNMFFGDEPYDGLGFYGDRDEVNVSAKYQF